jgi:uncharacterized protein
MNEPRRVLTGKLQVPADRWAVVESVFSSIEIVPKPAAPSEIALRDEDDRWILATAIAGRADVLVTGDEDLLAVAASAALPVLAPRALWKLLRRGQPG